MQKRATDAFAMKKLSNPPFIKKALYAWDALMKKYQSDLEWLAIMDRDYETQEKEIGEKIFATYSNSSDCATQIAQMNQYMSAMADITRTWQYV